MPNITNSPTIRPWILLTLAATAAAVGLASSAVTAQFFITGLQSMEADTTARAGLVAAGILMIIAELVAFFIAAVLPKGHSLRLPLIAAGVLLLAFETVTVFATQSALVQSGTALQSAGTARIDYLRTNIAQAQASAENLTKTGQEQVGSRFINQRESGAENIRTAHKLQAQANIEVAELAELLANQKTTLVDAFGSTGTVIYNAARALLLTLTGLIMMSAAGTLLRASATVPASKSTVPAIQPATAPTVPTVPKTAVPAVPVLLKAKQASVPAATVPAPDQRYQATRAAVLDGTLINPSVRAIQALVGGNTATARTVQACLVAEGLIQRCGQGYRINALKNAALC